MDFPFGLVVWVLYSQRTMMVTRPSSVKLSSPDDEFYNNLTLNIIQFLNGIPRITNVSLHKQQPCERATVTTWEQRHNLYLADDMKRFYLSTDGFTLHWSYQYSRKFFLGKIVNFEGVSFPFIRSAHIAWGIVKLEQDLRFSKPSSGVCIDFSTFFILIFIQLMWCVVWATSIFHI